MKKALTQTIETRLPREVTEQYDSVLREFAAHYSRCLRVFVARRNRGQKVEKSAFMKEFGLTGRQFNAIKSETDGLFQSQSSNYERYIAEAEQKNALRAERIEDLKCDISKAYLIENLDVRREILSKRHSEINGCYNRINKASAKIKKWQNLLRRKAISVCFGSKSLFHKQRELSANKFKNHAEWLAAFSDNRDSEIFLLGSKDEDQGNQSCTISQSDNGLYSIRLRLPVALEAQHGTHLTLSNVPFNYRQEKLNAVIESNAARKSLKGGWASNDELKKRHQFNLNSMVERHESILSSMVKRDDDLRTITKVKEKYAAAQEKFAKFTEGSALCDFGKALSCRFKRDRKGWRVILSISYEVDDYCVTSLKNGAIGIDLNEHHLSVAEMDARGNKVQVFDRYFRDKNYGDTSAQTKSGLGVAISEITALAVKTGKPIVIENLDFKAKKSKLATGRGARYNKMVSSLVTARFLSILKLRCAEKGIELIQKSAAYTSFVGRLKYNVEVKFNVHQAAAMVIARRGMGLSDRYLPRVSVCLVRNEQMYFPVPRDSGQSDSFAYFKKIRAAYNKWFEYSLSLSARPQRVDPQFEICAEIPF